MVIGAAVRSTPYAGGPAWRRTGTTAVTAWNWTLLMPSAGPGLEIASALVIRWPARWPASASFQSNVPLGGRSNAASCALIVSSTRWSRSLARRSRRRRIRAAVEYCGLVPVIADDDVCVDVTGALLPLMDVRAPRSRILCAPRQCKCKTSSKAWAGFLRPPSLGRSARTRAPCTADRSGRQPPQRATSRFACRFRRRRHPRHVPPRLKRTVPDRVRGIISFRAGEPLELWLGHGWRAYRGVPAGRTSLTPISRPSARLLSQSDPQRLRTSRPRIPCTHGAFPTRHAQAAHPV